MNWQQAYQYINEHQDDSVFSIARQLGVTTDAARKLIISWAISTKEFENDYNTINPSSMLYKKYEKNNELNNVLTTMWALNNGIVRNSLASLNDLDKKFFNQNLEAIQRYYKERAEYWEKMKPLK